MVCQGLFSWFNRLTNRYLWLDVPCSKWDFMLPDFLFFTWFIVVGIFADRIVLGLERRTCSQKLLEQADGLSTIPKYKDRSNLKAVKHNTISHIWNTPRVEAEKTLVEVCSWRHNLACIWLTHSIIYQPPWIYCGWRLQSIEQSCLGSFLKMT